MHFSSRKYIYRIYIFVPCKLMLVDLNGNISMCQDDDDDIDHRRSWSCKKFQPGF